ncbi:MAG TPA: putative quinol monooxygenase [Terracidiphilus sp.]|nr:putative quinol monooxygenase [Terracidiphilus sp.]
MIGKVVRLAVSLTINEGQTEAFNSIAKAMTEGSKSEPGTLGYEWFADVGSKRFTLLETYVDAAAVEAHFMGPVVQQWVPKLAAVCSVNRIRDLRRPRAKSCRNGCGIRSRDPEVLDGDRTVISATTSRVPEVVALVQKRL